MLRSTFRINGTFFICATIFFLFFTSCQREAKDTRPDTGNGAGDAVMVTAGVRGVVVDENNQPVSGATVKSGINITTTDRYGVFRFNNIQLSKENGYVRVEKAGYFNGNRSFVTMEGRIHNVRIKLLPKSISGTFAANTGGTVSLINGGKLIMPANAVTDASGNAYNGTVSVAMTWIDPTAANLPDIMVGDLRGITTGGEERGLATYGMLGVELTGTGSQPLKVATGKAAALTFPIPASIAGTAPNTIDLWHFDETKGRWIQEGTATKNGTNYEAQVSHFSFWNCDAPFPLINLCMRLVNAANSQPLINVQVRIKRNDGSYSYGYTDSTGNLCGKVPKNEPLLLEVMNQCNAVAWSQNIGPFSADASLGTVSVVVPAANTLTITGTLTNCANVNVTNGAVVIYTDFGSSYSIPVTNGNFSFTLLRCSSSTLNFAAKGIDLSVYKESLIYNGSGTSGTVNIGTLQACSAGLSEYIEYIIDGVPYTWADLGSPNELGAIDSVNAGTYPTKTIILGQHVSGGAAETTYFTFLNNASTGVFPLLGSNIYEIKVADPVSGVMRYTQIVSPANPTITITTFGALPNGYIEGNFTADMLLNGVGSVHHVVCHFKVKR
ncbi:MAG: carboxypeptidase-like regulatory domain-containing protein [Bacteroidetes bacterium]|nr:carboxypeptidase-like regulatory domain-containing protein [Bacteroidota bacterium]